MPHILRTMTTVTLGVPESKLRVIAPDVGGGFGGKIGVLPEEMLCVTLAQKLGKAGQVDRDPLGVTCSPRTTAATRSRTSTMAAKKDGTLTGIDVHLLADMGAYLGLVGPGRADPGRVHVQRHLQDPGAEVHVHQRLHHEDADRRLPRRRPPGGDVRIERIMDELAVELGRDPMELRQQNWIKHEEFPFTTVVGLTYDSGNYEQGHRPGHGDVRLRRVCAASRRSAAPAVTPSSSASVSRRSPRCAGMAPSRVLGSLAYGAGGWEAASIRMLATGKVEVITGSSAHGQGHETAFSQIVADQLGVPFEDVEVLHGDTQISPKGLDTYGSRSLVVGGIAIVKAAEKVIAKAKKLAAHLLEASEDDIEFSAGNFTVRGTDKGKAIQELAFAAFMAHDYPEDMEPSLDADAVYDPENFSFPHGTHLAAMEVDTDTGRVTLRKYVCVDDVGNVVNPLIVEGQVHGGLAQGIAQALFEEANYDDQGTLVNGTFVDYTLPSAADLPSFDTATVSTPATSNPLGVKGVGEAGTIASTPAIVNGVIDALRHLGVKNVEMPTTSQRVWRAIQDAKGVATQETPIATHSPGAGLGSIDPNNPQGETE